MKSLYIAVQPVGSKFAKALQQELRNTVHNRVFRVDHRKAAEHARKGRQIFVVTPQTLDKIRQLNSFKTNNVSAPAFTTDSRQLDSLGAKTIFARTLTNSTGGKGIVEFDWPTDAPPRAPLYTAYIPKKAEYRVHVFKGTVVDVQQKKKKREFNADARDTRVRNLANGYVYTRENIVPPTGMTQLAIDAVASVGYAYGAVDIIYNEKQNKCFVLEVNSRPGLMGTTLKNYANALISSYNLQRK